MHADDAHLAVALDPLREGGARAAQPVGAERRAARRSPRGTVRGRATRSPPSTASPRPSRAPPAGVARADPARGWMRRWRPTCPDGWRAPGESSSSGVPRAPPASTTARASTREARRHADTARARPPAHEDLGRTCAPASTRAPASTARGSSDTCIACLASIAQPIGHCRSRPRRPACPWKRPVRRAERLGARSGTARRCDPRVAGSTGVTAQVALERLELAARARRPRGSRARRASGTNTSPGGRRRCPS